MRKAFVISLLVMSSMAVARADLIGIVADRPFFHATDSLAARDEWGLLHQSHVVYPPDYAPRYPWRPLYWLESGRDLAMQPAYVGALQRDLARLGYYCGPIDGIFSPEVSDAIARLQKNYSQRVTGTLTVPVRRVLHLP
jgi:Putative peptidoglycan binding domain